MADRDQAVPMKVGANTMSFMWKTSAREALETLAREGYRRFELMAQRPHFDPFMERADALAFGRFLRDAGLTVETINMPSLDQNLASASPEMRDYTVRLFERLDRHCRDHRCGRDHRRDRARQPSDPAGARRSGGLVRRGVRARAARSGANRRAPAAREHTHGRLSARGPAHRLRRAHRQPAGGRLLRHRQRPLHRRGHGRRACGRFARGWASFTCPIPDARPGATTRSGRAAATSPASARRCARSATPRPRCWRSSSEQPVEDIVASHRRVAQWGWAALHA